MKENYVLINLLLNLRTDTIKINRITLKVIY